MSPSVRIVGVIPAVSIVPAGKDAYNKTKVVTKTPGTRRKKKNFARYRGFALQKWAEKGIKKGCLGKTALKLGKDSKVAINFPWWEEQCSPL